MRCGARCPAAAYLAVEAAAARSWQNSNCAPTYSCAPHVILVSPPARAAQLNRGALGSNRTTMKCQLALALLIVFAVTAVLARWLGSRARAFRVPASSQSDWDRYDPAAHTARANQLRKWSVRLFFIASASFAAFALLAVLGHATCWLAT